MKFSATVFLAAFVAMTASWWGFVLAPQLQLGREMQTNAVILNAVYPQARPGMARQGANVYRSLGCVYCHTEQVMQDGVHRRVILAEAGTNWAATAAALQMVDEKLNSITAADQLTKLPKILATNATPIEADTIVGAFQDTGANVEVRIVAVGPDIERGWGQRRTVARDYLFDHPVQLGERRIGPDLANIGVRRPDAHWHFRHLYAPASEVEGSTMPPYRFLFEKRKIQRSLSPDALALMDEHAPQQGYEIVPTDEGRQLVAYLLSLRADAPLFEAPFTPPPSLQEPATNAPAQ